MRKTEILDLVARKLSPFMFLFGLYLVSFGDSSPGGGFQGGAVIASGVILLAMARGAGSTAIRIPSARLVVVETVSFALFLAIGSARIVLGTAFLSDFLGSSRFGTHGGEHSTTSYFVFLLNIVIGVKVAAGISLICLTLFREE